MKGVFLGRTSVLGRTIRRVNPLPFGCPGILADEDELVVGEAVDCCENIGNLVSEVAKRVAVLPLLAGTSLFAELRYEVCEAGQGMGN